MHNFISVTLQQEENTVLLGRALALAASAPLVIYLVGDLGAGKTTLVRGFLRALGVQGKVKSPTYTLVENYDTDNASIYHFDLYRMQVEEEWEAAGFRDYFNHSTICLIEWPEKALGLLPQADIRVEISLAGDGRCAVVSALSLLGVKCLEHLSVS